MHPPENRSGDHVVVVAASESSRPKPDCLLLTVKGVRGGYRTWIAFALRLLELAKADPRHLHYLEIWLRAIGRALP